MALLKENTFFLEVANIYQWKNLKDLITFVAYILWQTLDQATMSHGLNAQQVNNLPHCHIFFGHMTDARDIALT